MRAGELESPADLQRILAGHGYLADEGLAVALYLGLRMQRPVLLEGEAGVGKTEVAKTLARILEAELIRLQCYEGLDSGQALFEWDYPRQLLFTRIAQEQSLEDADLVARLYRPEFLLERPLLTALRAGSDAVLLIDEVDRADDEFEAFLLEILSDYTVTVPELGTITAERPPVVIVTSNRTRELHDALKRRCIYHWIDYPDVERETEIVRLRVPSASAELARDVAEAVRRLRESELVKPPGIAEAIDWIGALTELGAESLDPELARSTLGCVVKNREDRQRAEVSLADPADG